MSAVSDVTPSPPAPSLPALDVLIGPGGAGHLAGTRLEVTPREEELAAFYASPPGLHVRANMVSSVDGGAWGPDHRSGTINDAADWRVFRVLRALADVVLVGAGTARAEGYTALDVPRGLEHLRTGRGPLELAVVTRSGPRRGPGARPRRTSTRTSPGRASPGRASRRTAPASPPPPTTRTRVRPAPPRTSPPPRPDPTCGPVSPR